MIGNIIQKGSNEKAGDLPSGGDMYNISDLNGCKVTINGSNSFIKTSTDSNYNLPLNNNNNGTAVVYGINIKSTNNISLPSESAILINNDLSSLSFTVSASAGTGQFFLNNYTIEIPSSVTLSENGFLKMIKEKKVNITSCPIGTKIALANPAWANGNWQIADYNHDSINTGQSNYIDLIPEKYLFSYPPNVYQIKPPYHGNTNIMSHMQTFYDGFSNNIKEKMIPVVYNSRGTWYNDEYVIYPSVKELYNYGWGGYEEGVFYPLYNIRTRRYDLVSGSSGSSVLNTRSWDGTYASSWARANNSTTYDYPEGSYLSAGNIVIIRISLD